MKKESAKDASGRMGAVVQRLIEVSESDTVYADVYLRRAGELLGGLLPPAQYRSLKHVEADIEQAIGQSKAATMQQDWRRVEALAAQVEGLRQSAQENAALGVLGAKVYDRVGVHLDPFSPGFESLPGHEHDLAEVRDTLVERLKALVGADSELAPFYESRRAFFAGFELLSKRSASKAGSAATEAGSAELQRLAAQAAQQGDMAQLRRHAQALLARQAQEGTSSAVTSDTPAPALDRAAYACPIDLAVPFSAEVVTRAQALGFAAARAEPLPQAAPLFDYVVSRVWQANLAGAESEREGTMRTAAAVDQVGFPKEVAEPVKVLVGQFLRNAFVNSGGARYLPQFSAEEVLIEDFPENQEPPSSELLSALGLAKRRGLARFEIDDALQEHGAVILRDRLGLDPLEFRLLCIPHDLYMRCGRERGWGQQEQWTHFDGYQVLKNGTLRALVGGGVRHGGLSDLLSIAISDQRESVVARFAVIRRARQVARWR